MTVDIIEKSDGKVTVRCAFCHGEGKDPFGLLSPLSVCQVCSGKGKVMITEPAIECAFCAGSGIHRDQRLTCTVCGGKGMVTIEEPTETCSHCSGKGMAPSEYLPCGVCEGKGAVTIKQKAAI